MQHTLPTWLIGLWTPALDVMQAQHPHASITISHTTITTQHFAHTILDRSWPILDVQHNTSTISMNAEIFHLMEELYITITPQSHTTSLFELSGIDVAPWSCSILMTKQ